MKNIQLAISGIAENVEFNEALGVDSRTLRRTKLAEFIKLKLGTNKITFAKMLGVSPATVTKWLYTETVPSYHLMKSFATKFGLELSEVEKFFE